MHLRIKAVRKDAGKTQKEFGESLGVSRDTLASYESGRVIPSKTFIQLLCSEYHVSEDWLLNNGDNMYVSPDRDLLDELADEYHLNNIGRAIVETFLTLPPDVRDSVITFVTALANKTAEAHLKERLDQIIDEHEQHEQEMGLDA